MSPAFIFSAYTLYKFLQLEKIVNLLYNGIRDYHCTTLFLFQNNINS